MVVVEICMKFGWDYYTYMEQPSWFIDLIIFRMTIDAKKAKQESIKAKHKR